MHYDNLCICGPVEVSYSVVDWNMDKITSPALQDSLLYSLNKKPHILTMIFLKSLHVVITQIPLLFSDFKILML